MSSCLIGCGNSDDSITENNQDSSAAKTDKFMDSAKNEKHNALTITSFNSLITQEFFNIFYEKHPEVTFKVQSYSGVNGSGYAMTSLENGDIPDIYVTTQSFNREAQEKYLLDLSNYDFINNYTNTLLDSLDINGGIYLLPSGYQLTGIYYNKTIMAENGWDVPKSFKELKALSKKIKAAGYKTVGHGMSLDGFPFNYFFNIGNTGYFGTPEGTQWKEEFPKGEAKAVGNDELKKTVDYFKKWVDAGFITTQHMETEQFYEGESVFFLSLGLNKYEYTAKNGKTYEFGTIPWLSEDGSNNMLTRSVSRYMGINKSLIKKGNEQKLEDALTFMNYISTSEGQKALMSSSSYYMPSLNESSLPADSPYQEIADLVSEGRTVNMLYVGWEKLIIPIAQDVKQLIEGEASTEEMLAAFDATNDSLLSGDSDDIYAKVPQTLTLEETAKLVALAEGKAVDVDCAMISLNEYHEGDKSNNQGLGWYLYKGDVNMDMVNQIRPKAVTISILEMTGAEIKEMRDSGFDLYGDSVPYEYLLFTKGDIELKDEKVYKLAISTGELTEEMRANAVETEVSPATAIKQYVQELKTITADVIKWE